MLQDPILAPIYCVLDGLDECEEASLEAFVTKLKGFFLTKFGESSTCSINLILVSRDLPDFIPDTLSTFPCIDLYTTTGFNNDIHQFIEVKVNELSEQKQYPGPLRLYVKKVFSFRAEGTFLWDGIVAQLLKKYKATEVEKALAVFPQG